MSQKTESQDENVPTHAKIKEYLSKKMYVAEIQDIEEFNERPPTNCKQFNYKKLYTYSKGGKQTAVQISMLLAG